MKRLPWGLGALLVVLLVLPFLVSEYWLTLLSFIGINSIVVVGLVLLTGFTGQVSLGHAAFYGIGAYSSVILAGTYGVNPWLAIVFAAMLTGVIAYLVGGPTLRLSGHYLALATIALSVIVEQLFKELPDLTGGPNGFSNIPQLEVFGFVFDNKSFYALIWVLALLSIILSGHLVHSRTGRALRGIRSSEAGVQALGVPVAQLKLQVFVLSAVLASVAGSLFAFWIAFISPSSFNLSTSIKFITMAMLGGVGNVWGALVGAAALQFLDALLLELQKFGSNALPSVFSQGMRLEVVTYGLLLTVAMIVSPEGLWGWLERPFARFKTVPSTPPGEGLSPLSKPPASSEFVLDVRGISKAFGGLLAVNQLSFQIRQGEILGLIGPNGAGKSTAFNLITGVYPLTDGEIEYRDARIDGLTPHQIARRGILRTFQNTALFETMTVLENAVTGTYTRTHAGMLAGMFHTERREEAKSFVEGFAALEAVGLQQQAFSSTSTLPVGQRRLLEVGRAIAGKPDLLLLDEPAAGLRYAEKAELIALLSKLQKQGLTILLVEHDMDLVMRLADRIVVMSYGQKIAEGTPSQIQANPVVIEAYLGQDTDE